MTTKKHDVDPVAEAEDVLASIGEKTAETLARKDDLLEAIGDLGFRAHGLGDLSAKKRISELSEEAGRIDHELVALGAAQVEASRRLAAARRAVECEAHRALAEDALAKVPVLREAGAACSEAMATFISAYQKLYEVSAEMRRAGIGRWPRDEVFSVNLRNALQYSLWSMPGHLNTQALPPPSQRREIGAVLEHFIAEHEMALRRLLDDLDRGVLPAGVLLPGDYGRPPPLPRIPGEEYLDHEEAAQ